MFYIDSTVFQCTSFNRRKTDLHSHLKRCHWFSFSMSCAKSVFPETEWASHCSENSVSDREDGRSVDVISSGIERVQMADVKALTFPSKFSSVVYAKHEIFESVGETGAVFYQGFQQYLTSQNCDIQKLTRVIDKETNNCRTLDGVIWLG